MVNNLTNINKKNNHLSPQIIEHATDQISAVPIFYLKKKKNCQKKYPLLFRWTVCFLESMMSYGIYCYFQL